MRWLFLLLPLLLGGCVKTEARLVWHADGRMELELRGEGPGIASYAEALSGKLRHAGFVVQVNGEHLLAKSLLKPSGWDRLTGWIPGRFSFEDPSGLRFYRVSYLLFEDYGVEGVLRPAQALGLPALVGGVPFRFVIEAPFEPITTNATLRRGGELIWEGILAGPLEIRARYRFFRPERGAVLILLGLALWRRSRRPRAA